jgi:hypothetical protein
MEQGVKRTNKAFFSANRWVSTSTNRRRNNSVVPPIKEIQKAASMIETISNIFFASEHDIRDSD